MRKIILNLAISLDGFISDIDGGFDWIVGHGDSSLDTGAENEFQEFLENIDTVVMGSKSYEDCVLTNMNTFEDKEIFVATTRILEKRENVTFINGDICKIINSLKNKKGKDIFIFGGAKVANSFIKENLIDEYIIGIIPTILGKGRKLFEVNNTNIKLHLDKVSIIDGITILHYSKKLKKV